MNPTVQWYDETLPLRIGCAPGILTGLEIAAMDGLLAMPRIGLAIGGALLGRREQDRIEVLKSVPIPCSHSTGPSFALTSEETEAALAMLAEERQKSAENGETVETVGWYCSKTNGRLQLTGHDRVIFDALCPEPWQTVLLIRPSRTSPTTGAFGFRCFDAALPSDFLIGELRELAWQELSAFQTSAPPPPTLASAPAAPDAAPAPTPAAPILAGPEDPVPPVAEAAPAPATLPAWEAADSESGQPAAPEPFAVGQAESANAGAGLAEFNSRPLQIEMPRSGTLFGIPEPPEAGEEHHRTRRWPLRVLIALVLLTALAALASATRQYWVPRPPVALVAYSYWNGTVVFLWNAEAFGDGDEASLIIDDGDGPVRTIHLDRASVLAGWLAYDCRPGPVNATLLSGDTAGSVTVTARAETYLPESGISK